MDHEEDYSFIEEAMNIEEADVESEERRKELLLMSELAKWATVNGIKTIHLTRLLHILKAVLPFLPLDGRTLKKTMRVVSTKEVKPGHYYHFGIQDGIKKNIVNLDTVASNDIGIVMNVDGIPLTKSTNHQFWPITARILEPIPTKPFVVGIYYGPKDPEDFNVYLEDSVNEANDLGISGVQIYERNFNFRVVGYICDAPARAKIKCTVLHNSYNGCTKCTTKGVYFVAPNAIRGRVTFPQVDAELRTNESFRARLQPEHHCEIPSKIEELEYLDMIFAFPEEEMHLIDLGVMKKMLLFMKEGKSTPARLPKQNLVEISTRLESLKPHIPDDFARKPRSLDELHRWKATECHLMLMYTGIVVLNGVIPQEQYQHFTLLYIVVRILSNPTLYAREAVFEYCEQLCKIFVLNSIKLYGQQFVSYNVHCLIHLPSNVRFWKRFGPLYSVCAYPFENLLQAIKGLVVAKRNMLQQVVKRIDELDRFASKKTDSVTTTVSASIRHANGPMIAPYVGKQFEKIKIGKLNLSRSHPNNTVFITRNNVIKVFCILNILELNSDELILIGHTFDVEVEFFNALSLSIHTVKVSSPSKEFTLVKPSEVKWKACRLPDSFPAGDTFIVSPLPLEN
jgi:hypothetical protein